MEITALPKAEATAHGWYKRACSLGAAVNAKLVIILPNTKTMQHNFSASDKF